MTAGFGDVLRALLGQRGWSLGELARQSHYDKGYLSRVMNNRKRPSAELAAHLDELLGAGGGLVAALPAPPPRSSAGAVPRAGLEEEVRRLAEQVAVLAQVLSGLAPGAGRGGAVRRAAGERPAARPRVSSRYCSRE